MWFVVPYYNWNEHPHFSFKDVTLEFSLQFGKNQGEPMQIINQGSSINFRSFELHKAGAGNQMIVGATHWAIQERMKEYINKVIL